MARSVLNIILGHKNIANYDITVITKTSLESHCLNDIPMHLPPMYSVTESSMCHKMLQKYELLSTTKPEMSKGKNSNKSSDKYVDDFVNSFANVEDILFIVLRGNTYGSEVRKRYAPKPRKQTKSKSKSTPYIDDKSNSLLEKLSKHKYRIFAYLGQNVRNESPTKWKSSYSLMYALDDGFAMKLVKQTF